MTWLLKEDWSMYIGGYVVEDYEVRIELYHKYKSWYVPFHWNNIPVKIEM